VVPGRTVEAMESAMEAPALSRLPQTVSVKPYGWHGGSARLCADAPLPLPAGLKRNWLQCWAAQAGPVLGLCRRAESVQRQASVIGAAHSMGFSARHDRAALDCHTRPIRRAGKTPSA
jgi:hypothetical protein